MAAIRRTTDPDRQIAAYGRLRQLFRFFATWEVLDWTSASAAELKSLKASKIRVGTMDMKIASIALANGATLLSRNLQDFQRISGLRVADWLA